MTSKKKFILFGITSLLILFCVFKTGAFRKSESDILQVINKLFLGNEMNVKVSNDLKIENVKIKISSSEKIVFENGHFLNNIGDSYGGPIFDVYYNGTLIGKALHDNRNNWYVSEFNFTIFNLNGKVKFKFITNGKDKNGDEGYIWIEKKGNKLNFESFDSNGKLINKWTEQKTIN